MKTGSVEGKSMTSTYPYAPKVYAARVSTSELICEILLRSRHTGSPYPNRVPTGSNLLPKTAQHLDSVRPACQVAADTQQAFSRDGKLPAWSKAQQTEEELGDVALLLWLTREGLRAVSDTRRTWTTAAAIPTFIGRQNGSRDVMLEWSQYGRQTPVAPSPIARRPAISVPI